MTASGDSPPSPFTDSLRQLGDSLVRLVQNRLHLLVVELHEEKYRLILLFMWIGAMLFTGLLALTFASLALVYAFWEESRLGVLGGLAGFYTLALAFAIFSFRRQLSRQPRPFAGTEWELEEDRACIRKKS